MAVGPDDDFFALGGKSLAAAVIAADVADAFGVEIGLDAFTRSPTVAQMSALLARLGRDGRGPTRPPLERIARGGPLPVSWTQELVWRRSRTPASSAHWTISSGVSLRGPLDVGALRASLDHLVRRHEMLRTTFSECDGLPRQVVHSPRPVELPVVDLAGSPDPRREAVLIQEQESRVAMDLVRLPLLRFVLRLAPHEHRAAAHRAPHPVRCPVLVAVLQRAGHHLEDHRAARRVSVAAEPDVDMCDLAAWERRWLFPGSPAVSRQLDRWQRRLEVPYEPLELPFARREPDEQAPPADGEVRWGLERQVGAALDALGCGCGATFLMTRLALFCAHLAAGLKHEDLLVGVYLDSRAPRCCSACSAFGQLRPLRLGFLGGLGFRAWLVLVRDEVVELAAHADLPYELLCSELARGDQRAGASGHLQPDK